MSFNGGRAVVDALHEHDVRTVFTVPGESFLPVLDALYDVSDIDVVATRHEEGAAFAAEAYAKASGAPGVCMVTRGVGSTHAAIAIHTAMQDATPLVVLVGQVGTDHKWREAFQELDLPHAYAGIAKHALEIPKPARIGELVSQAFRVATSGRPGPVIVGLPEDVLYGDAGASAPFLTDVRLPAMRAADRDEIAAKLSSAERPAMIVGREVLAECCTDSAVRLSEATGIPVYTAFRRFDAFPNDHRHYAGNVSLGTPRHAVAGLYDADLVLVVGDRFDEITAHGYDLDLSGADVIHVASDASLLGNWRFPSTGIVASAREFLDALATAYDPVEPDDARIDWARHCRATYERTSAYEKPFPDDAGAVNLSAAMASLRRHAPPDTALVTDAGNFSAWVPRYFPFVQSGTHFGPISGAMGYAVPGAVGIALANPDRRVVALAGDGGFAMTMNELAVAGARKLPIIFLVFVNEMYATIRMHQEKHFPGRPVATDLHNPDFVAIAEAHGINARRATSNALFDEAIGAALTARGPVLIEVLEGEEKLAAWRAAVALETRA
ncbi:MAG: thiamine pyrophosphate-binding protein [Trueperaceae bacterium]|nr:thiamine pyrophosphate-binding protein [Trueperaceae bacterium]